LNEKLTRKEIIDFRLTQAGWDIDDYSQVRKEFFIQTNNIVSEPKSEYKSEFSDYVLLGKNGKALAVIEAKKASVDANIGKEQAKQYAYNVKEQSGGDLPFCFYTNGQDIYFWDLENHPPRKVFGFPSRDDLERFSYLRKHRKVLSQEFINTKIAGREYQIRAIRSVMEAIERKRTKFLLVMATGTGKTRTCISLVDALMRGSWVERVLFLVDRIALQGQALDDFKEHLPNEPRWPQYQESSFAADRRIYVSTFPTMLNIIRNEKSRLTPHFFDLIIVDESHRSIYNTYQEILQFFNTLTLGLTATPTDVIDHNTFELFDCEDGLPTFAYSYEEAVNHVPPYLCDFQVMKIKTKFQGEGINKRTISLEDQKKLILEGKEISEINYEGTDLEKRVINKGTNTLIVREFMEECIKDGNGVLPGKTIFFCISKAHARRIEEIFNSLYPELNARKKAVIITERKEHIISLQQYLKQHYDTIALSGEDSDLSKKSKWAAINRGDFQVLITTGQYFGEGTDIQNIECLFLVYPFAFEGKLIQYIGRVQRSEVSPIIYDYRDHKISYLERLFQKRNLYYKKLDQSGLTNPVDESETVSSQINENIEVSIEQLEFRFGSIAFKHIIADFNGKEVEFEIENLNVRPEFTVLKPYFIRFLKSTTVLVNIRATVQHNRLVFKSASSSDLDKINREVIESVKFRFLNKEIIKGTPVGEENLLDAGQVQGGSEQLSYTNEDDLLENILALKQYKHHRHLRYLSQKHKRSVLKLRFVLEPFSFVFLLSGNNQYHLVWETLDTEEATYVWHIARSDYELERGIKQIDGLLGQIRTKGRQQYLETNPEQFSRIVHDYTNDHKGFIVWKDLLEEKLF
jgi:superfamily II DNA or RNA helicase